MAAALRVAFFGDSWMGEWHHGTVVPTPIAVSARTVLQERLQHGFEMTVVAFPGCTAMHALCLAEYCSVQDMAYWSSRGWSIRSTIAMYEEGDWPFYDEVDLIVVMLGSNDLVKKHEPFVVARRLTEFQKLYAQRGKEVAFVTVGGAGPEHIEMWPGYEEDRVETNRLLKATVSPDVEVVDMDDLVAGLHREFWIDGWHLHSVGYATVGRRLGEALAQLCARLLEESYTLCD